MIETLAAFAMSTIESWFDSAQDSRALSRRPLRSAVSNWRSKSRRGNSIRASWAGQPRRCRRSAKSPWPPDRSRGRSRRRQRPNLSQLGVCTRALLPEQLQRDVPVAAELPLDLPEIERIFARPRRCGGCREECRLQLLVGPFRRDGPGDAGGFGSSQVLMDGAGRNRTASGDLALIEV